MCCLWHSTDEDEGRYDIPESFRNIVPQDRASGRVGNPRYQSSCNSILEDTMTAFRSHSRSTLASNRRGKPSDAHTAIVPSLLSGCCRYKERILPRGLVNYVPLLTFETFNYTIRFGDPGHEIDMDKFLAIEKTKSPGIYGYRSQVGL